MALMNPFRLEKLRIEAYKDSRRLNLAGTFEAMFNPDSLVQTYGVVYSGGQGLDTSGAEARFSLSPPSELNLKLILDGTGVSELGLSKLLPSKKVSDRVAELLALTYQVGSGARDEPNYLRVSWGDFSFSCRLSSLEITYNLFDRDGTALRAELKVSLIADEDSRKRIGLEKRGAPSLTHSRLVTSAHTLPLLAKEVYGSSAHYLLIAKANGLDDFRLLSPGQNLSFPPLPSAATAPL